MKKLILFALSFITVYLAQAQNVLYVDGRSKFPGNGTRSKPFEQIQSAVAAARMLHGHVVIDVAEGVYRLTKPLILGGKITYDSLEIRTSNATITSNTLVNPNWQPWKKGIWRTKIDTTLPFDQLFINGELKRMARYPNFQSEAEIYGGYSHEATSKARVAGWINPAGGYVHALHKSEWGSYDFLIEGKDAAGQLITKGGYQNNRIGPPHQDVRFVENIFEELDTSGEWYVSKRKGFLYYVSDLMPGSNVETPLLENLINLDNASHVSVKGFRFTGSLRTFMKTREPLLRSDWAIYRMGALLFRNSSRCSIIHCDFKDLGGNAIFFDGFNNHNAITGCLIEHIGVSAVCFVGRPTAVRSPLFEYHQSQRLASMDKTPGPANDDYPSDIIVENCLIRNIGGIEKQVAGVQISIAQNISVLNNTIYNVPRAGINVNEGTFGGHLIQGNDVFNTVLESGDHGAFNAWGRDRWWHPVRDSMDKWTSADRDHLVLLDVVRPIVIRGNRFRCDKGWDIDLDDGSSNYTIENNLLLSGGLKLREGFFRRVENNVIINNTIHTHLWFANSADIVRHNIITAPVAAIRMSSYGQLFDQNIFLDSAALLQANAAKHDLHSSVIPDAVVYVDGKYAVSQSSGILLPAAYGVRSPRLKALAAKPALNPLLLNTAQSRNEFELWFMTVQNPGEAERSATGMDGVHGVYVINIARQSPFYSVLKPNDMILGVNDAQIDAVSDLVKLKPVLRFNKSIQLQVFRDQRMQMIEWKPR